MTTKLEEIESVVKRCCVCKKKFKVDDDAIQIFKGPVSAIQDSMGEVGILIGEVKEYHKHCVTVVIGYN